MICPRCQSTEYYTLQGRSTVRCKRCKHDFSETSGTVWKATKLDQQKRQAIIDLLDQGKNRYHVSVASGVQYRTVCLIADRLKAERRPAPLNITVIDPKREYRGPYLMALPPPSWWFSYVPTVPPYRIMVTHQGNNLLHGLYKCQREAMGHLWDVKVGAGETAELLDSKDGWIARITQRPSPALSNGECDRGT